MSARMYFHESEGRVNIPYCTETSVIRDLFYIPISVAHAYDKCFNTKYFYKSLSVFLTVFSFYLFVLRRLVTL